VLKADWQFTDLQTAKLTPFDQHLAGRLEKSYQEKNPTYEWKDPAGGKHCVTFASWTYQDANGKQFHVSRNEHGL